MNLFTAVFKRITTAVTSPFRRMLLTVQRLFNVNIWASKLVKPLTKFVRETLSLKPKSKEDYYTVGKFLVFKKVFLAVVLLICAGIFLYFTMFADPVSTPASTATAVVTNQNFSFDDMDVKDYTGVANITAATGEIVFTGDIEAGIVSGSGTLLDRDGNKVYEGAFAENMYEGEGVKYYESGSVEYIGQFSQNLFSGGGNLYYPDGTLWYSGDFQNGEYSGEGELYNRDGLLTYSGNFLEGSYHGAGISYFTDGTKEYEGEFFEGRMQGHGKLYSRAGILLYTGTMYNDGIDYRTVVNSNLEQIDAAFEETPVIYYTDTASLFAYEQAGILITMDTRVQFDMPTTQTEQQSNSQLWFLNDGTKIKSEELAPLINYDVGTNSLQLLTGEWYYADGTTEEEAASNSAASASQSTSSSQSSSSSQSTGSSQSTQSESSQSASSSSTTTTPPTTVVGPSGSTGQDDTEDLETQSSLYFEVDTGVWQPESELDKTKIQAKRVTVISGSMPDISSYGTALYEEDSATTMDDCVAIDYLRLSSPTLFSNVVFQLDKYSTNVIGVDAIDFASKIVKLARYEDGLTYRYNYQTDDRTTMQYFSVER